MIKMIKEELLEKYPYKTELHAHTNPASGCSEFKPAELVKVFADSGYSSLVITNHFIKRSDSDTAEKYAEFYFKDFDEATEAAAGRINVCLGMEIRFVQNNNDYLVYGIGRDDVEKAFYYFDKGIDVFYREFKNDKNVIIQAHPFRDGMESVNPASLDGIEVFNLHAGHNSRISHAAAYAADNNFGIITAGLDFHHPWQIASVALRTSKEMKDSYDVSEVLKSGDYVFSVGNSIILP